MFETDVSSLNISCRTGKGHETAMKDAPMCFGAFGAPMIESKRCRCEGVNVKWKCVDVVVGVNSYWKKKLLMEEIRGLAREGWVYTVSQKPLVI